MTKKTVIALGGNAILNKGEEGTFEVQYQNVYKTMENIVGFMQHDDVEVVITHGNGPQVGSLLIQNACAQDQVPAMPMYACGAMSQGLIGLFIQQALYNILQQEDIDTGVVTVVTQVLVDQNDPSFKNPSKPVGPFYTKEEGEKIANATGHIIIEDAGRGYRRVVPSPKPLKILEIDLVDKLMQSGALVVASGGGGIPVVEENSVVKGVDAVIDKDRSASLMARQLDADVLVILTAVDKVSLNFDKEDQEDLEEITVEQAKKYSKEGHFAEGSMKPKIEAAIEFVKSKNGRKALITHPSKLIDGMDKEDGTWIVR